MRVVKVSSFSAVWSTAGTKSRTDVSFWSPALQQGSNRLEVCLGHYAEVGLKRNKTPCFTLELYGVWSASKLKAAADFFLPFPVKYHQLWAKEGSAANVYLWAPIPPSEAYLAIGCIATTTPEEPSVSLVRCMPKSWLVKSRKTPVKLWDDSGMAGKKGSLWLLNCLGFFSVSADHKEPTYGCSWEIFCPEFKPYEMEKAAQRRAISQAAQQSVATQARSAATAAALIGEDSNETKSLFGDESVGSKSTSGNKRSEMPPSLASSADLSKKDAQEAISLAVGVAQRAASAAVVASTAAAASAMAAASAADTTAAALAWKKSNLTTTTAATTSTVSVVTPGLTVADATPVVEGGSPISQQVSKNPFSTPPASTSQNDPAIQMQVNNQQDLSSDSQYSSIMKAAEIESDNNANESTPVQHNEAALLPSNLVQSDGSSLTLPTAESSIAAPKESVFSGSKVNEPRVSTSLESTIQPDAPRVETILQSFEVADAPTSSNSTEWLSHSSSGEKSKPQTEQQASSFTSTDELYSATAIHPSILKAPEPVNGEAKKPSFFTSETANLLEQSNTSHNSLAITAEESSVASSPPSVEEHQIEPTSQTPSDVSLHIESQN